MLTQAALGRIKKTKSNKKNMDLRYRNLTFANQTGGRLRVVSTFQNNQMLGTYEPNCHATGTSCVQGPIANSPCPCSAAVIAVLEKGETKIYPELVLFDSDNKTYRSGAKYSVLRDSDSDLSNCNALEITYGETQDNYDITVIPPGGCSAHLASWENDYMFGDHYTEPALCPKVEFSYPAPLNPGAVPALCGVGTATTYCGRTASSTAYPYFCGVPESWEEEGVQYQTRKIAGSVKVFADGRAVPDSLSLSLLAQKRNEAWHCCYAQNGYQKTGANIFMRVTPQPVERRATTTVMTCNLGTDIAKNWNLTESCPDGYAYPYDDYLADKVGRNHGYLIEYRETPFSPSSSSSSSSTGSTGSGTSHTWLWALILISISVVFLICIIFFIIKFFASKK